MEKKLTDLELRTIQLELLKDVHMFCQENGIRYSLAGGSLLGAVRHHGYIPWDDDIDLMMPREDYERFASTYHSACNEVLDLRENSCDVEIFIKVSRKGTRMVDLVEGRCMWGVNIDIFPIDGAPEDSYLHGFKIMRMRRKLSRICPYYMAGGKTNRALGMAKYLMKRILYPYFGSAKQLKREIDTLAASYKLDNSQEAGVLLGSYGIREICPAKTFLRYSHILFEGEMYSTIVDYDTYLSAIYGDYMKLPPVEKRISHHLYDTFADIS